jgi:HSP90 family molecular chaperone
MKQNITLSLEKEIIKKGKVVAARKDTSVSKMLSDLLKSMVEDDERYEAAKKNALQLLKKGIRLGGAITWKREELHER